MEARTSIQVRDGGVVVSEVVIGSGLLTGSDVERLVGGDAATSRFAILAQPGSAPVAQDLGGALGAPVRVLPDREAAKQLRIVEEAYLWLNELGFARGDLIVAVGGGALTDVAGFIAGTYLRGVPVVLVPTTLLGAVDAAIGGKTGVNVGGKNLAGVFRHPQRVLIDIDVIAALPETLLREGSAEAVKAGLIGDPELVVLYERHGLDAPLGEIVERAVRVKAEVVSSDFRERGVRAVLNYGHTIGHAVEVAAGVSHGEAVSIGMVAAGAVAEARLGFTEAERQRSLLTRLGLPITSPPVDAADVRRLVGLDKKRAGDRLRMVLLRRVGVPELVAVDDGDVARAMAAAGIGGA